MTTTRWTWSVAAVMVLALVGGGAVAQPPVPADVPAGDGPAVLPRRYPKCWALVVGINYAAFEKDGNRSGLGPLTTAASDARELHDVLCRGYGYRPDGHADGATATLLLEEQATRDRIVRQIEAVLCDPDKVGRDDSVLVYFAGHGVMRDSPGGKAEGVLIPADAAFDDAGRPRLETCVRMRWVVDTLRAHCPARHKLLVLDCCHAGDIFAQEQQVQGATQVSPFSRQVYLDPAFQGMAATRRTERAADQLPGTGHSPFTHFLLESLRRLPARQGAGLPIPATSVFYYVSQGLDRQPRADAGQRPRCCWLTGDQGEFHFFPAPGSEFLAPAPASDEEVLVATTLLPGAYGAWWFQETPWFIPALRERILREASEVTRGGDPRLAHRALLQAAAMKLRQAYAADAARAGAPPAGPPRTADEFRRLCLDRLSAPELRRDPRAVYAELLAAFEAVPPAPGGRAAAGDLHLAAVLRHELGREDAVRAYDEALAAYATEAGAEPAAPTRPGAGPVVLSRQEGLTRLCRADRARCLADRQEYLEAAREFGRAYGTGVLLPAPFEVSVLVQEAVCWQRIGRGGEADHKLARARAIAEKAGAGTAPAPGGAAADPGLLAYVLCERGWVYLDQFNGPAAADCFRRSNAELDHVLGPAPAPGGDAGVRFRPADWAAQLMRFHSLHGLALVERSAGRFDEAARQLAGLGVGVRERFGVIRWGTGVEEEVTDLRERLAERLVTAHERTAECFLLRDPPDPREALDGLAKAVRVCHYLPPARRDRVLARLWYKQAVAYALPGPARDAELARACRAAAVKAEANLAPREKDGARALRDLATALTELYLAEPDPGRTSGGDGPPASRLDGLRGAVHAHRPGADRAIARDDLDWLLLAGRVLLTEGLKAEPRFVRLQDAEEVLGVLRVAIRAGGRDTQAATRPHYDAAIRALIAARPGHVKGLVEAAWEATTGRTWTRPGGAAPVLAAYVLDGRVHFFLDVPGGCSAHFAGGDAFRLDRVRAAAAAGRVINLPAELADELERVPAAANGYRVVPVGGEPDYSPTLLNVHWFDTVNALGAAPAATGPRAVRPLVGFPFALPGRPGEAGSIPAATAPGGVAAGGGSSTPRYPGPP